MESTGWKIHEVNYNGEEVSDEELMKAPGTKEAETTIPCIETADGKKAQEVNRCAAVPVKKGYSYKVILYAQVGSQSSVEVGKVYFTVRDSGRTGLRYQFRFPDHRCPQ